MNCSAEFIAYQQTGYFSKIVTDYIAAHQSLQSFYNYTVSIDGIKAAIAERKKYNTDRKLLTSIFKGQYQNISLSEKQISNINNLNSEDTFTITTAHQPNIFTGHLYFIYKILHVIKLSEQLKETLPQYNFVPVYYMGSEDADLAELNHIFINGDKHEWKTEQKGAVGRMKVDKDLLQLIEKISGELLVCPFGNEIIAMLKKSYPDGVSIEQATFSFVNQLFSNYGLLILLPDSTVVKNAFAPIIHKELMEQFSHKEVMQTVSQFPPTYSMQASGREINLFYLQDGSRNRIVLENNKYTVQNSTLQFDAIEIIEELKKYPERFSPNVILRPVLQELILPNIVFVGGGGEIAYWLELRNVFNAAQVPYPMLVVRNSFLFINKEFNNLKQKLAINNVDLFTPSADLINGLVKKMSSHQLNLTTEKELLNNVYQKIQQITATINETLTKHTNALQASAVNKITELEKKMLRAEKKKFEATQRQLQKLKLHLFPNNNLQERVENITLFYAKYGAEFIKMLYQNSNGLDQIFVVLEEEVGANKKLLSK